jgi:molecular chaperone GrpE
VSEEPTDAEQKPPEDAADSSDGPVPANAPEQSADSPAQTSDERPPKEQSPEELLQSLQELQDQHLRFRAEFDNFRKRTAREQQQIRERASENIVKDLLPVIDDLERACAAIPPESENGSAFREGIELVLKSLQDTLTRHGLKEIDALSQPFDPNLHEAVMAMETEDHPADTVTEEVQKGYTLRDRVIRPSRVVVAKPVSREEE